LKGEAHSALPPLKRRNIMISLPFRPPARKSLWLGEGRARACPELVEGVGMG